MLRSSEKRVGVPHNNLRSGAVLGHGASWALVRGTSQGSASWQLITPCARSAVADLLEVSDILFAIYYLCVLFERIKKTTI